MATCPITTNYGDELALARGLWPKIGLVLGLSTSLLFPWFADGNWITIVTAVFTTIVGAIALMILTGLTGQISLGHAAFLALGAYTAAIVSGWGMPFWLVLPLAGIVAAGVGLLIGPFALRLRGMYLALVTIGVLYIVKHVLATFSEVTGGLGGISVPMHAWFVDPEVACSFGSMRNDLVLGPIEIKELQIFYYLCLAICIGAMWFMRNLTRTNTGRAMIAVRDHDLAAASLGVNVARTKLIAFGVSSFLAGVAGALIGWRQQFITIDPPFNLYLSMEYVAMLVVGGIGTLFGAVAGAVVFTVVRPLSEIIAPVIPYVRDLSTHQQSGLFFGVIVITLLLFEPMGIYGIWLRIKRFFASWPFSQ